MGSRNTRRVLGFCSNCEKHFPYDLKPGYLIFDRAANFNEEVICRVNSFGIQPKQTSFRSPWQNGVAERWVGTVEETCSTM